MIQLGVNNDATNDELGHKHGHSVQVGVNNVATNDELGHKHIVSK